MGYSCRCNVSVLALGYWFSQGWRWDILNLASYANAMAWNQINFWLVNSSCIFSFVINLKQIQIDTSVIVHHATCTTILALEFQHHPSRSFKNNNSARHVCISDMNKRKGSYISVHNRAAQHLIRLADYKNLIFCCMTGNPNIYTCQLFGELKKENPSHWILSHSNNDYLKIEWYTLTHFSP